MPQKIKPSDLGCGQPYFLSYSARLHAKEPEHAELLWRFINRYKRACVAFYALVRRLFENPRNHLALYAIFLPSRVPEAIERTWFWSENIKGHPLDVRAKFEKPGRKWGDPSGPSNKPKAWADLNQGSTYALFAVLANPKGQIATTRPGRVFQQMIGEYGLKCVGLKPNSLEWIFRFIPGIGMRDRVAEGVAGVIRSRLSTVERVNREARERLEKVRLLDEQHPAFFGEIRAYIEDARSWHQACQCFEELRKAKREEFQGRGLDAETVRRILWAAQRAAMRKLGENVPAWSRISSPTADEEQLATEHANLVTEFLSVAGKCAQAPPEEDVFRRFGSTGALSIRLANEPDHLARIIDAYDRHVVPLSPDLKTILAQRRKTGGRSVHAGWETICRAFGWHRGKDGLGRNIEAQRLHDFIGGEVRAWFQNIRPMREPQWPDAPGFWPMLDEGREWERVADSQMPCGNSMTVRIRIPGYCRKVQIIANLRGYLPQTNVSAIEAIEVANGLSRFTPNQVLTTVAAGRRQKTYIKLQAMRLLVRDGKVFAKISATQMTEFLGSAPAATDLLDNLGPQERVGVFHLYPGGRRLGQLVVFERRQGFPGWKQIALDEITADTRAESFEWREDHRVNVRSQRKLIRGFIVFDETPYFLRRGRLEGLRCREMSHRDEPCARETVGPNAVLGEIHYRQLAARVASICRYNRMGFLLIAGTGRLNGVVRQDGGKSSFLTAPTHKFVTVRQSGNHRQVDGVLIHALQKAGVTTIGASARARNFWVKPYLQNRTLQGCLPARPYREDSTSENGRSYNGKRTLIAPDEKTPGYPYPLNACWAILLDWSLPEFRRHVGWVLSEHSARFGNGKFSLQH